MHMRRFGEVLTDMERRGIRVDAKDYLAGVEVQARKDRKEHVAAFRKWAHNMIGIDGIAINPASSTQLGTFLFGGAMNAKTKIPTGMSKHLYDMKNFKSRSHFVGPYLSQINNRESSCIQMSKGGDP